MTTLERLCIACRKTVCMRQCWVDHDELLSVRCLDDLLLATVAKVVAFRLFSVRPFIDPHQNILAACIQLLC